MSHSRETVTADPGPPAAGPYSHAVKSNGLLFISGQVHLDPDSGKLIDGSPAEKAKRCLDNLTIIAEAAGARLENAVRVAVYVTDISVFAEMNEAYATYFPSEPPARTTIGVAALPMGAEVEMDAIIALPS
jgi:2-iminobutanoate/2-iminopropanoate deaminase